jgi:hypothetical protein
MMSRSTLRFSLAVRRRTHTFQGTTERHFYDKPTIRPEFALSSNLVSGPKRSLVRAIRLIIT